MAYVLMARDIFSWGYAKYLLSLSKGDEVVLDCWPRGLEQGRDPRLTSPHPAVKNQGSEADCLSQFLSFCEFQALV